MRSKNRCAIAFHDLPLGDRKKHVCGSGQLYRWNSDWVAFCKVPRGTDTSSWMVCKTVQNHCYDRMQRKAPQKKYFNCPERTAAKLKQTGDAFTHTRGFNRFTPAVADSLVSQVTGACSCRPAYAGPVIGAAVSAVSQRRRRHSGF
jgi:hypothetical protein